jgi:hypothetical protein
LSFETSLRYERALADITKKETAFTIIGVRQTDAVDIAQSLAELGITDVTIVYLGRFSNVEAGEIARRVAPGREVRFVQTVMVIIRDKHLPRTPFTITLLMELLNSGKTLKNQNSEIEVLNEYLNLLLFGDFYRVTASSGMSLRNKRVVIQHIARRLVEGREDKAPYGEVAKWVTELFDELGWSYEVDEVLRDLKQRRILSVNSSNEVHFQRAIYLELLAGIAAKDDEEFRSLIMASPLELASILRMYAAMTRNDKSVLEIVDSELDRIAIKSPTGSVFASVRQRDAPPSLFQEALSTDEPDGATPTDGLVDRAPDRTVYYDRSDDSDRPTFLAARVEDLPPARVAMLVVDLASRVLRDSDEIRDQEYKQQVLGRLLQSWVMFLDLFQAELTAEPRLDEVVERIYNKPEAKPKELLAFKNSLLRVVPSYITYSGLSYCLSSPTLDRLLSEFKPKSVELGEWAALMRTLTLYSNNSTTWIETLSDLSSDAVRTWLSASFLANMARYAFIADARLTDNHRDKIRAYLRDVVTARYSFSNVANKNTVLNNFEADLRSARLREQGRIKGIAATEGGDASALG